MAAGKHVPASVQRGLAMARKNLRRAPEIIAARSKNIQLRNEMIHARMAEELRTKAVLKQAEAARLGYKDGLLRDNEQFKAGVRDMISQSLGELRGTLGVPVEELRAKIIDLHNEEVVTPRAPPLPPAPLLWRKLAQEQHSTGLTRP